MKIRLFTITFLCLLCTEWFSGTVVNAEGENADVSGTWELSLEFVAGTATHTAVMAQDGEKLAGTYKGEFKEGTLSGVVDGDSVVFIGSIRHEATGVHFRYTGTVDGDTMKGAVDMGEYWTASFSGKRLTDARGKEK